LGKARRVKLRSEASKISILRAYGSFGHVFHLNNFGLKAAIKMETHAASSVPLPDRSPASAILYSACRTPWSVFFGVADPLAKILRFGAKGCKQGRSGLVGQLRLLL
jgi:hypothetical protein